MRLPMFEAGREKVGKKGVVTDPRVHKEVIVNIESFAASIGFEIMGLDYSPIKGPEGNIEYLLWLKNSSDTPVMPKLEEIDAVVSASEQALAHK